MTIIRNNSEYFIKILSKIHGNKYDYISEEFEPNYSQEKVADRYITRICKHSKEKITYKSHRKGKSVCRFCENPEKEKISKKDKFINKLKESHPHLDLSEVDYNTQYNISNIKCNIHQIYYNISRSSLIFRCKYGSCPLCIKDKKDRFTHKIKKQHPNKRKNKKQVIIEANKVHNHRYDYSLFDYIDSKTKSTIICKLHGQFKQTMDSHINRKANCPVCVKETNYVVFEGKYNEVYFQNNYSRNTPGVFYIIKLYSSDEEFVKIGITSKNIEERFKYLYLECDYKIEVLYSLDTTVFEAFVLEQKLLKKYKNNKHKPLIKFKGYTECFNLEQVESLRNEASVLTGAI